MTKVRKKIGTIPINDIEQQVQQSTQAAVTQMQQDITDFIDEETAQYPEIGGAFKFQEDPEERSEITTDAEGKIISYRDSNGVKHENVRIETDSASINHLNLTESGMTEFQQALKDSGFNPGGRTDWSNAVSLEIPMPRCAMVNITNDEGTAFWPSSKEGLPDYTPGVNADMPYYLEFWDMQGNYFKKPILMSVQGNGSLAMPKHNGGFDMFADTWDGEAFKFKIGNWITQDSYHVKAYWADYFVGVCPIGYKLFNKMTAIRDIYHNRDWKRALLPSKEIIGYECNALEDFDDKYSLDNDARCFPDGFPCIVYLNGEFFGIYSWQLKKHRNNYMMSKKNTKHIHLDGRLVGNTFFLTNGNFNWAIINGDIQDPDGFGDGIEFRNPKPKKKEDGWDLTCIDGSKYNGDTNRKELIGSDNVGIYDATNESHKKTNQVKQAFIALSTYLPELMEMEANGATAEQIRVKIAEHFDVESFIDYIIFCDLTCNWDGLAKNWQWITWNGTKWFVEPYDLDSIFGWTSSSLISPDDTRYGSGKSIPTGWFIQYYLPELNARYKVLRDSDAISLNSIVNIFKDWIAAIGTDNYQKNHDKWPIVQSGNEHKDSIFRIYNWLEARIAKCDEIYNYNQN